MRGPDRYAENWVRAPLDAAEAALARGEVDALAGVLAPLPPDLFFLLYFDRPAQWPRLSAWLPRLPTREVQAKFTGAAGFETMLEGSRFLDDVFAQCPTPGRVLDYGCGWGRMLRLLYRRVPVSAIYGVEPQADMLALMAECGVHAKIAQVDIAPTRLPFAERFDLIFAYSVFTHLSPTSQAAVLRAMRGAIAPEGMLVVTVRPSPFWNIARLQSEERRAHFIAHHAEHGWAFNPHAGEGAREMDYGDTTISIDHIRETWRDWRVEHVGWRAGDDMQIRVFLRPA